MQKVALMSGTNLVADLPGILDVGCFTKQGDVKREIDVPRNVLDPEGQGYGIADFAYKYLVCRILRGNVFIRVDKVNSAGRPDVMTILNPDQVTVYRDPGTGQIKFRTGYNQDEANPFRVQPEGGIIHRRANAQPGQILGLSVIQNHARTLGLSISSEQFGSDFFADGAHPTGILSTDQPINEEAAKTIKQRFLNAVRGSREPAVLGAGVQYTPIQVKPEESQFLETQKWTAAEVCRIIGPGVAEMLGYETGGRMQYQNVQQRSLHLLIYTADKWLKDFEAFLSDMLLANKQLVEFDRTDLMRMVPKDRWDVHSLALGVAATTINEVRKEEGMNPVPWGDEPFLPAFGSTGTAAAQMENIDATDGDLDGKLDGEKAAKLAAAAKGGSSGDSGGGKSGKSGLKVKKPNKIGGVQ